MKADPGLALRSTSLATAFGMLAETLGKEWGQTPFAGRQWGLTPFPSDPAEAVEDFARQAGMRARRVLLDRGWWKQAAMPMLARVVDRRQRAREDEAHDDPWGRGWVVLVPAPTGGYRMRAAADRGKRTIEWKLDARVA